MTAVLIHLVAVVNVGNRSRDVSFRFENVLSPTIIKSKKNVQKDKSAYKSLGSTCSVWSWMNSPRFPASTSMWIIQNNNF